VLAISRSCWIKSIGSFIYFGASTAGFAWIVWTYGCLNLVSASIVGLLVLYFIAALFSVFVLLPTTRSNCAGGNFDARTHKLIRLCALILPVPALAYCAYFQYCLLSYDTSEAAEYRLIRLAHFERSLFRKSVIYSYFPDTDTPADFYENYMKMVESQIGHNWHPHGGCFSRSSTVTFEIVRDGTIRNLRLEKSSGSRELDTLGLMAVNAAVPFKIIPAGKPDSLPVQFAFDYRITESQSTSFDDAKFESYLANLVRKIEHRWRPPEEKREILVSVTFDVSSNGSFSNLQISERSNIAQFDRSVLEAMEQAAPFGPFPSAISAKSKFIMLDFDYECWPSPRPRLRGWTGSAKRNPSYELGYGSITFLGCTDYEPGPISAEDTPPPPTLEGYASTPEEEKLYLERMHVLERKFGKHLSAVVVGGQCVAPIEIDPGLIEMYGVKRHKRGKDRTILTGVIVGCSQDSLFVRRSQDKPYRSIKVYVELDSKKEGIIRRDFSLGESTVSIKYGPNTQEAAPYTHFEWLVPRDLDLHQLQFTVLDGR